MALSKIIFNKIGLIMKLQFLGATETVTGSKYLITTEKEKILIDCGLFQGVKELRLRNWRNLPIDPKSLDAVILTHAHIDHSGYIPLLIKQGFTGKIFCSKATYDLCTILLPDSGHLQEEEAANANRYGSSKHNPALPLYTREDAEMSLASFQVVSMHHPYQFKSGLTFSFRSAGHILGACSVYVEYLGTRTLFSGDLGRLHDPIMKAPEPPPIMDYLILESTYGDRLHSKELPEVLLQTLIEKITKNQSILLLPSFAVGRAQAMLYYIYKLFAEKKVAKVPVYMDSPMAIDATKLFCRYKDQHRLSESEATHVCAAAHYIQQLDESISLQQKSGPMIVISASGMATGGRVLSHLQHVLTNPKNIVLFTGYQARETRGEKLLRGEKTVRIYGEDVPVLAEIHQLSNISAHADYSEILTWLKQCKEAPKKVFITHGESLAAASLAKKIEKELMWSCKVPTYLEEVLLT